MLLNRQDISSFEAAAFDYKSTQWQLDMIFQSVVVDIVVSKDRNYWKGLENFSTNVALQLMFLWMGQKFR